MKEEAPREKCLFFLPFRRADSDFLSSLSVLLTDRNSFPSLDAFRTAAGFSI